MDRKDELSIGKAVRAQRKLEKKLRAAMKERVPFGMMARGGR